MTRHIVARIAIIALTALPLAASASDKTKSADKIPAYTVANTTHAKTVKIKLHNKADAARSVKIAGEVLTLEAGQEREVVIPVGTVVYASGNVGTHADGDRIVQVTSDMSGAVCSFS